jgi:hypothetical protein
MNELYKFVDIIKKHEEVKEGFESMELATGATIQPLRDKIENTLNSVYGLIAYIKADVSRDTVSMELIDNILATLEGVKEELES